MIGHKGATIQSLGGGGGGSIFKVNILRLNFHGINNCKYIFNGPHFF